MTVFQDRLPNDYASLVRRIEALERQLQQAQAARRLEASTIGRGGITVQGGAIVLQDASGNEIARMGIRDDLNPGPDGPQPGFILRRSDGSIAFALDDPDGGTSELVQILKMQDATGHIIFSEDSLSGWGMASPTFAPTLYPSGEDTSKWPAVTTTTFTTMWLASIPMWNPKLEVGVYSLIQGAGNTGEIRLLINSQPQGSVASLSGSNTTTWSVLLPSVGITPGTVAAVEIQARMVAGAGPLNCTPVWFYGSGT